MFAIEQKVKFDEQNKICIRKHFREPSAGARRYVSMSDYPLGVVH